jgi:hypothetical protein
LIQRHHAPVNIVGGYKFPNAPKIEIAPQRCADTGLMPNPPPVRNAGASGSGVPEL